MELMGAEHRRLQFTIGTDQHAPYREAFATSVKEKVLPSDCKPRRFQYHTNVIEQEHRFVRKRWGDGERVPLKGGRAVPPAA